MTAHPRHRQLLWVESAEPAEIDDSLLATLERRVRHLESELAGFQDAVYRQSAHPDEPITELRDKDQPPNS